MQIRVILVTREGREKDAYVQALKSLPVRVDTVSTFRGLEVKLTENRYQGVMVDLKTKIKAIQDEKELVYRILEQFPVVQLRLDDQTGEIKTLYYGKSRGDGSLQEFVRKECGAFKARSLRSDKRFKVHFNLVLFGTDRFSQAQPLKTVTLDISKGGCFIFSTDEFDVRQRIHLMFIDLKDKTPIEGEVRWIKPWGSEMQVPGIGVKFIRISKSQRAEIQRIGNIKP